MEYVYFDYNATAPMDHRVMDEMIAVLKSPNNASSIHSLGKKAKLLLENSRSQVLKALNLDNKYQVVFTSSGTESNNLALRSIPTHQVITSVVEHPSVLKVVGQGMITVNQDGIVDLDTIKYLLSASDKPVLISIMAANNETGVIQPIKDVIKLAKQYNALVHTDATQIIGKADYCWEDESPDLITISAHKFGGPLGAAALIYRKELDLKPILLGGGQEFRLRSGTQNIPAIVGMGTACDLLTDRLNKYNKISKLRDFIELQIKELCQEAIFFGEYSPRIPNTTSISMPGVKSEIQIIHFDLKGIAVSAGSACSSGRVDVPYVQISMGYSLEQSQSAIRVSLGPEHTEDDANKFIKAWNELYINTGDKR